jgi:transcriptional regulator with XRE-family HTH domain
VVTDSHEVAKRVRAARAYADFTREQLASRAPGITSKILKDIETGHRRSTSMPELSQIATACDVPLEFLLSGFAPMSGLYDQLMDAIEEALGVTFESRERFRADYERAVSELSATDKPDPAAGRAGGKARGRSQQRAAAPDRARPRRR